MRKLFQQISIWLFRKSFNLTSMPDVQKDKNYKNKKQGGKENGKI